MKRSVLFLAVALAFILFPEPVMAQCQACDEPCPNHFRCSSFWGEFLDCQNIGNCRGCAGWYCEAPLASADEQPTLKPFNRTYVLTAVTIINNTGTTADTQFAMTLPLDAMPWKGNSMLMALTAETLSRNRYGIPRLLHR